MLALPSPARRLTARIAQPTTPEKGCVVLHGEPRQGQQWTIDHPQRIFPSPPRAIAPIFPWNPQVRQKTTRTSHFSPLRPVPASLHSHHTYPRNIFVAHHIARMACPHYYCPSLMQLPGDDSCEPAKQGRFSRFLSNELPRPSVPPIQPISIGSVYHITPSRPP
jgi:hypothetical protein